MRGGERETVFISERIINISECEKLITAARFNFELLMDELQKDKPSKKIVDDLSCATLNTLQKAERFEFCLEKRKCYFKEVSVNPKVEENQLGEDNAG